MELTASSWLCLTCSSVKVNLILWLLDPKSPLEKFNLGEWGYCSDRLWNTYDINSGEACVFVLLAEHWLLHTVSLRWIPDDALFSVQWTCWWKTLTTGIRSVFYWGGKRDCTFTTLSLLKLLAKFNPYTEYFPVKYLLNLRHSLNRKSKYLIGTPVFKKKWIHLL